MTSKELNKIREDVECEGFLYAFCHYDDYLWVEDAEFHKKLAAFQEAVKDLADYCGVSATE